MLHHLHKYNLLIASILISTHLVILLGLAYVTTQGTTQLVL